jgi:hypothetical protein
MFSINLYLLIVLSYALFGPLQSSQPHDPPTIVPQIARIAGIRVGYNTMEEMEQLLGKGMMFRGSHPNGGREWRLRGTPWYIDSTFLDYYDQPRQHVDGSLLLNDVSLSTKRDSIDSDPVLSRRTTRRTRRKLGWLGIISPGVSQAFVLRAIHGKLPLPQRSGEKWTWIARGFVRLRAHQTYNTWTATLTFHRGRLAEIDVFADQE